MRTLALFTLLICTMAYALERPGQADIDYLLKTIETSGCKFIRNGSEHDGKKAAEHLRMKLANAGGKVLTVDDFIDGIATKSSITGELYQVRKPDGTVVPSGAWFREMLKKRPK